MPFRQPSNVLFSLNIGVCRLTRDQSGNPTGKLVDRPGRVITPGHRAYLIKIVVDRIVNVHLHLAAIEVVHN
jgi:hypothetical protein